MKARLFATLLVLPILSGCALLSRYGNQAASPESAGEIAVSAPVPDQVKLQPMSAEKTRSTALGLFNRLYYVAGYAVATPRYRPGQFTRWEEGATRYEKAFLQRDREGREWWRFRQGNGPDDVVFEALLSPANTSGMQQILSLRAQLPGQGQVTEVAIPEEDRAKWQLKPSARLSFESMTGSMLGWEPVKTKAGLFRSRHVRHFFQGAQVDWWLCDEVPGGIVKYSIMPSKASKVAASSMTLTKFGPGASR